MNLQNLRNLFADKGCPKIYVKVLSANDNSKNQIYFGGSFEILNILPISDIRNESAGEWKKERFKATINFSWMDDDGVVYPAPQSQLILYPKYPEVRFSGFLQNCEKPPSDLMTQRLPDRILFFGVADGGKVIGYVTAPESEIANEYNALGTEGRYGHIKPDSYESTTNLPFLTEPDSQIAAEPNFTKSYKEPGVFKVINLPKSENNRQKLLSELLRIYELGWIRSKRLNKTGNIVSCESPNCGGYTLEAEFGITPNGYAEPDYLGWEIKQYNVSNFTKAHSAVITLMTPEPTDGYYKTEGAEAFIKRYGYLDRTGRENRMNFGGIHTVGNRHHLTNLKIVLQGFDSITGKIRRTDGKIALIDNNDIEAASWSFSSLLRHWNRKHNQACYVPSLVDSVAERRYRYGSKIILGIGTDFQFFLKQMSIGNIYYDPGIKMENLSTTPKIKKRSQFRIKSQNLPNLYKSNEIVDIELAS
ncbi:MAG: MvaI/BcnI family restriction endonuclease [Bacteroidetes bacterium]|nr:MvaI/BcnI family restriction endonuclease [Bacteroidota bacterium]